MKFLSVAALVAAAASTVNAITVNTPASAVECQPLLITWDAQGSAGPFYLSVVSGTSPSSPPLFSWSNLTGSSYTWVVAEPAGTSLGLLLRDQTGATSQSAPFSVQNGTSDCLTSSSSASLPSGSSLSSLPASSSVSRSSTSTPTQTPTSTKPSTTISTSTPTSVRSSSSSSSSSSSRSPTATPGNSAGNTSGGVINSAVHFGAAGVIAVFVGAILA